MRYLAAILLVLLVLLVAGCTSVRDQGLSVSLQADPPVAFSQSGTTIHIDIDNRQEKQISNVAVELFDTGMLSGSCSNFYPRMLPYEFQTLSCWLAAPQIITNVQTEVNAKTSFESKLSADQSFEVIDENEYQRRLASGSHATKPRSYVYGDKNAQIAVEFSDSPPLVMRPDKKYFVYFTVTNTGNGIMGNINPGDFSLEKVNPNMPLILVCPSLNQVILMPSGKSFPKIACEIKLDPSFLARNPDYPGIGGSDSADFLINLRYTYELRNILRIDIVK